MAGEPAWEVMRDSLFFPRRNGYEAIEMRLAITK